ncbi:hypothetical protein KBD45_04800 [Candidatus Dojkabacteria bacterium]|nr:hypothetical protein [Candidatus Dojkabacteria bacterium]
MLEEEFQYYLEHQKEFLKSYENKFLLIQGLKLKGVYDTEVEAYEEAKEKYELGKFLIQKCTKGDSSYTQTFHSRVNFKDI